MTTTADLPPWFPRETHDQAPAVWAIVTAIVLLVQLWAARRNDVRHGYALVAEQVSDDEGGQGNAAVVVIPTIAESWFGLLEALGMGAVAVHLGLGPGLGPGLGLDSSLASTVLWAFMAGIAAIDVLARRRQSSDPRTPPAFCHVSLGFAVGGFLVLELNRGCAAVFSAQDVPSTLDSVAFPLAAAALLAMHVLAHRSSYVDIMPGGGSGVPRIRACSIWELATQRWVVPTLTAGMSKDQLGTEDLCDILAGEEPAALDTHLNACLKSTKTTLAGALARLVGPTLFLAFILHAIQILAGFAMPAALQRFGTFLEAREQSSAGARPQLVIGYTWSVVALVGMVARGLGETNSYWWSKSIEMRITAVLHAAIARALLASSKPDTNAVSLAANDARKLASGINAGVANAVLPFRALLAVVYLGQLLGWIPVSCVAFVVAMVVPTNLWIGRHLKRVQSYASAMTDARLSLARQALEGIVAIRLIKTQVWEHDFEAKIDTARQAELAAIARATRWGAGMTFLGLVTPPVVTVVAFTSHALVQPEGSPPLPPSTIFAAVFLLYMLDWPMRMLPFLYGKVIVTGAISYRRLTAFFAASVAAPALQHNADTAQLASPHRAVSDPRQVVLEGGVQVPISETFRLSVPGTLTFPAGELSLVVGPLGSGKTTLLLSLLG
ncbi:ABC transporter transmembrane region-domain-containing protein, partial [Blastocladiella britannica]